MIPIKISKKLRTTYRVEDGVQVCWAWCRENFGAPGWQGNNRWDFYEHRTFVFEQEKDAIMFALKWS